VLQLNPRAGEMPALLAELFLTAEKAGERAAAGLYNQLAIEWAGLVDESVKRGRQGQEAAQRGGDRAAGRHLRAR